MKIMPLLSLMTGALALPVSAADRPGARTKPPVPPAIVHRLAASVPAVHSGSMAVGGPATIEKRGTAALDGTPARAQTTAAIGGPASQLKR